MRMLRFGSVLLAALALIALALPAAAQPPRLSDEVITEADTGRAYTYKVGKKFKVVVPDPGDGHQFKDPTFDAKILKLLGRQTVAHDAAQQKPGDVGKVTFTFEVIGVGKTDLLVHFFNPKDKNPEPMEMLKVNVEGTN